MELAPIVTALAAPIIFGNLEGTLTDTATSSKCAVGASDCFAFHVPTAYAQIMRQAGFTVLNSANPHSHDFGAQGVADTSTALRAAGIAQTGLPGQIALVTQGTTRVAFIGFAPYIDANNLLDLATARQLIATAKQEADLVVVYMHAGAEGSAMGHVTGHEEYYLGEDRGNAKAFAHAAVDDGAALVLASGPHVLRGMEYYHGHLITYSLGNFANYHDFAAGGVLAFSGIVHVTLDHDGRFVSGQFRSINLDTAGRPTLDPSGGAAGFINQLSTSDFGQAAAIVLPSGELVQPPVS